MNCRSFRPAALVVLLASLAACAKRETLVDAGIRTQTLHINYSAEPGDFDPHTTTLASDGHVILAVMEGLTTPDPLTCMPVPGVAERWETSADGLTWTFHLRGDARWSNGDPVTAADFVYTVQRILSPALGAPYREQFHCLRNAEAFSAGKVKDFSQVGAAAADDRTLVLTLERPMPYLPALLAQQCWAPVHRSTIEKFGRIDQRGTAWTRPGNHVGNGPFVLREWQPSRHVRLVKSETYWDRERVRLREVYFYPIENPSVADSAYRAGQLHVTLAAPDKVPAYRANPRMASHLAEGMALQTAFFRINCQRPPFDDVRVRRALSLAIDRETLARRVIQADTAAHSFTPPDTAGYSPPRKLPFDVAEARRLLAEAGFPDGRGFPPVEIPFYVFYGSEQPALEAVQHMWRTHLGISVSLVKQESKVVVAARNAGKYQLLAGKWQGDYLDPVTFLELGLTDNGNNRTGWSNRAYDRLLAAAALATSTPERFARLREAEAILLEEVPFVPLYFQPQIVLRHPAVKGWHVNLLDLHVLTGVYLER